MAIVRVSTIVATTHWVEAYGGVRFHIDFMDQIASAIRSGTVPMRFEHDLARPVSVSNVDAGVRQRDDGEHEVWCEFDADEDEWSAWESHLALNGASGGMSFAVTIPVVHLDASEPALTPELSFRLAADAHHFARADLLEAGVVLTQLGPVAVQEVMQFSHEPPALIVLGILMDPAQQVAWGVVGNHVYDVLRRLRSGKAAAIHLEATAGDRNVKAIIPADTSDEVAREAIEAFERIATQSKGIFRFDSSSGWRPIAEQGER